MKTKTAAREDGSRIASSLTASAYMLPHPVRFVSEGGAQSTTQNIAVMTPTKTPPKK